MFDILTQYLFEHKRLQLPSIGVFKVDQKEASADYTAAVIAAPTWLVTFSPYDGDVEVNGNLALQQWLAGRLGIAGEEAGSRFSFFVTDLNERLNGGETISWPGLGSLEKAEGLVRLQPDRMSPFTDVVANKVTRDNISHQTLVGDRETTTAQMREQLSRRGKRGSGSVIMWILLAAAVIAAAWFLSQKGCTTAATGNQQPIESAASGDTYRLR